MNAPPRLGDRLRGLLRLLDRMLGIDRAVCGDRFWLTPGAVLLATFLGFLVIGEITAAPLYVSLPNGAVIALVMSGLTVACMTPGDDTDDDPPGGDDDCPVLGSPGGPWVVLARVRLGDVAPHRQDPAEEREQQSPAQEHEAALPVGQQLEPVARRPGQGSPGRRREIRVDLLDHRGQ
jgi:hypothetical protein